jgi:hypothetical protein
MNRGEFWSISSFSNESFGSPVTWRYVQSGLLHFGCPFKELEQYFVVPKLTLIGCPFKEKFSRAKTHSSASASLQANLRLLHAAHVESGSSERARCSLCRVRHLEFSPVKNDSHELFSIA